MPSGRTRSRLSDALLKDLIEHLSKLLFGNKNVNSDLLGDAYEYLIKKFADATNKKAGEFYTPRSVVRLMTDILAPKEVETIYDPACGTSGMLLAAVQHVKEQHGEPPTYFSACGCTNYSSEDLTSLGMVFFVVSERSYYIKC